MNILGIDPASHYTGVAIISDSGELLLSKTIATAGDTARVRGLVLFDELMTILNNNSIDEVVIEDVLINKFSVNLKTCRDLCIIHGIVLASCHSKLIPHKIYTANQWKSTIGIFSGPEGRTRQAQKTRACKLVETKYGIKVDDNQADAICIALAHLKTTNRNAL